MFRTFAIISRRFRQRSAAALLLGLVVLLPTDPALAQKSPPEGPTFHTQCQEAAGDRNLRVVCADLVALDQMLVYNRFGSFNPFGMIFALRRDVVPMSLDDTPAAIDCGTDTGTQEATAGALSAGGVRLRDCRRPRPMVLRANVGDLMYLRVTNLLAPGDGPGDLAPLDLSADFCPTGPTDDRSRAQVSAQIARDEGPFAQHGTCFGTRPSDAGGADTADGVPDWPRTRSVNLTLQGLRPLALPGESEPNPACSGLDAVAPNEAFTCLFEVVQEGTHFLSSRAAPSGGNGDGGSITHGLFGAVMAERPGTRWYRSQVSQAAMDAVWAPRADAPRHARQDWLDYEHRIGDVPVLNLARSLDGAAFGQARAVELVHADLNAIIWCDAVSAAAQAAQPLGCAAGTDADAVTVEPVFSAFREFSVFFHDELKTFYTRNFEELAQFGQLAGVRDAFAINYGASGMGTLLLANRKGIGPSASCMECLYEEFFLTSWANGDPALLEWYADDPSNVHHSYLNDPVVFRNFHAGPKETHVFHLHAHQWFAGNDPGRGSYLDSQTVAPGQGFSYNIYHGGRRDGQGGPFVAGSGNRNRTVGDSIFHCHLYPHFAQGMWALWRVHDVFEDGSRKLPDGQATPGLSAQIRAPEEADFTRTGSVDPRTGAWLDRDDPATPDRIEGAGTPIPALVPLPGEPLPPLPSYADPAAAALPDATEDDQAAVQPVAPQPRRRADSLPGRRGVPSLGLRDRALVRDGPERLIRTEAASSVDPDAPPRIDAMPGYPFYIAGAAGHRPPQAPRDIARRLDGEGQPTNDYLSGGLGRHVVTAADRTLDYLTEDMLAIDTALASDLDAPGNLRRLEALRSRIVAKALALGDMSAHLDNARIRALHPEGEPLEQAAQAFHYDGAGLTVLQPDGTPASASDGSYQTLTAPLPGGSDMPPGRFHVNGAPAAPGAPFADPCGGAPVRDGPASGNDPFVGGAGYVTDPDLLGFRRYEVSAVQLDLVVNQAGWHDPQARIDVLTDGSDGYKDAGAETRDRISPRIRDDSEPFFFRAISGECIEFRHTNELPKDLELDDFQVKTPTDTIGQHIHLVKFDVTASDGSGNGWNYEDGTFAADELMARRCANLASEAPLADNPAWGFTAPTPALCDAAHDKANPLSRIWRLPMGEGPDGSPHTVDVPGLDDPVETRDLFQTTVQRWFADPIMTLDGEGKVQDRTMRTVFSHDHFGPSSIQQHGFYTALLIEPGAARICDPADPQDCTAQVAPQTPFQAADADADWVGSHKVILANAARDPFHPDYREFALAVADFALLYDPRERDDIAALDADLDSGHDGMARLNCEAQLAATGRGTQIEALCGNGGAGEPQVVPAWWAAGAPGGGLAAGVGPDANLMRPEDADRLRDHLVAYRTRASSIDGQPVEGPVLARPVAPPARPESISVDHHDPYLVNYRNAPIPLRLATKNADGSASADCVPFAMSPPGGTPGGDAQSEVVAALTEGRMPLCSYRYQLSGLAGDAAYALSSFAPGRRDMPTREPETPRFEAYQDERLMFRLIQGAQEVQHSFNVAGLAGPRNVDQRYARGMRALAASTPPARQACFDAVRRTRPEWYDAWLDMTPDLRDLYDPANADDQAQLDYFARLDDAVANCDNVEGYTFAQEIGISEHFELRGRLRADVGTIEFDDPTTGTTGGGIAEASDYLYNFGTADALWNGAWGLLRVYADEAGRRDLLTRWQPAGVADAAPAPPLPQVGRMRQVAERGAELVAPDDPELLADAPGCPLPTDPRAGPNTALLLVALRTADLFPGGTDYGGHRHDPDGLMLAALNPDSLPFTDREPRDMRDDADWTGTNRPRIDAVLAALRNVYARPEPLVVRVNAGDCVSIRYLNALRETAPGAGMPDQLGDALMPPIAPLNTDPQISVSDGGTTRETRVQGTLSATTLPVTGLRPSAHLALSIGLPGGDLIRTLPLGYGINAPPMAPAEGGRVAVSGELRFYAGRMRIAPPESGQDGTDFKAEIARNTVNNMQGRLRDWLGQPDIEFSAVRVADNQAAQFTVLGTGFSVDGADLTQSQVEQLRAMAATLLHKNIRWIPYAYGPVPVRVTGDMISQTTHGLFGVIDVVPRDWTLPAALVPPMAAPDSDAALAKVLAEVALEAAPTASVPVWRSATVAPGFGAPARFAPGPDPAGAAQRPVREFVIFYQDGLNHHDARSLIQWRLEAVGEPAAVTSAAAAFGALPRITPDCLVCDDSYDWGEQGVSYRSRPFASLLRFADIGPGGRIEASDDMNALTFPDRFLAGQSTRLDGGDQSDPDRQPLTLQACPGEQVLIRAVHPGGRARQRAFALTSMGYDDLFPGFGFPNAALLAPVKSVSAWLHPPTVPGPEGTRVPAEGTVLWHDGPSHMMAGGTWGLIRFAYGAQCPRP